MSKRLPWQGKLYNLYRVECATDNCHNMDETGQANMHTTRAQAERKFRREGWSRTREGWTCPWHTRQRQERAG